ncbi:MAG: hypothetical protein ACLTOX_07400 [Streptococcus thermophilus]
MNIATIETANHTNNSISQTKGNQDTDKPIEVAVAIKDYATYVP